MRALATQAGAPRFGAGAFIFLKALAKHNEKPWFESHRAEYEREIKTPLVALVEEMDARFGAMAPEIVGDTKRSLFRIHRDVRFARDKSPYHSYAACWFFHRDLNEGGKGAAAHGGAGFYFHLQPGRCLAGGGIYMPPAKPLGVIRDAIAEAPETFAALVAAPAVKRRFGGMSEEAMLTRPPRGFSADHPAAPWLRYKSFTLGRTLDQHEVMSAKLADTLAADYARLVPFVRWLNEMLGLRPSSRR